MRAGHRPTTGEPGPLDERRDERAPPMGHAERYIPAANLMARNGGSPAATIFSCTTATGYSIR